MLSAIPDNLSKTYLCMPTHMSICIAMIMGIAIRMTTSTSGS